MRNFFISMFLSLLMTMTFSLFVLTNNAEAVTPQKVVLQSDTSLPCGTNGWVKFKGGTYVVIDSSNMGNVMSGTLAQDTFLSYTLNYSPNTHIPAMSAKFKGGSTVGFIAGQGNVVGLVTQRSIGGEHLFSDFFRSHM